jgi:osmotically-inducible protein OsmY
MNPMTLIKRIATLSMAGLLLTAMGCASTSKQSSTGEYIDDSVITSKVKTAIFNESDLKVFQIGVETRKSVVQLSGFVGQGGISHLGVRSPQSSGSVRA